MVQKRSKIDLAIARAKTMLRSDPGEANKLADWAFKESQSLRYEKGQGDSLATFAALHFESNAVMSYDFALKAIEIYRQINDESCIAETLLLVAKYYDRSGWTSRSHYVLREALDYATRSKNEKVRALSLFNLGVNSEDREDFQSALDYFICAKIAAEEAGHEIVLWRATCAEQEMHDKLKDGLLDVDKVFDVLANIPATGTELTRIEIDLFLAKLSWDASDYWKAREILKRAYTIASKADLEPSKVEILCKLGELKHQDGRHDSAKRLLNLSRLRSRELGLRSTELACLKQLAQVNVALGNSVVAFEYLSQYSDMKDELFSQESKKHFQEMRTDHDLRLLEEESRVLKQTNSELAALNEKLESALDEKKKLQNELERLAKTDELTGTLNRRELLACGAELVSRFHSQGRPSVVLIVDIDHFKSINDAFGHSIGDEVLRRFTIACERVLRPTDRFGRLGGEEFGILLDRTTLDIALKVAERVMSSIRNCRVADLLGDRSVTASIGVVELNKKHESIEAALHDADLGLYEAKRTGRDKICVTGVKKKKAA